jgi:nucleotide-binding universal stress UspA family protein
LLTGDEVCKAVLRYARALAETGDADIIAVPVITDEGITGLAHVLVGPASQLFTMPALSNGNDPFDRDIIDKLNSMTRALQPSRPQAEAPRTDVLDLDLP